MKVPGPRVQVLSIEGEPVSARSPAVLDESARVGIESPRVRAPEVEAAPVEALGPHPWPELASAPSAASEALASWPELPPLPSAEPMGVLVELREWERLRRLEREQRGE